jgi:protoheme IX farnesyltransferase
MQAQSRIYNRAVPERLAQLGKRLRALAELGKASLTALVLLTVLTGFVLASTERIDWLVLMWTLLGTGLSAAGANGLNQYMERRTDRRMARTRGRPLPNGRLRPRDALAWSLLLAVAGPSVLASQVNPLAAGLAIAAEAVYVLAYTPLKTRTSLCTLAGAVCGAAGPMIGWAAAAGRLEVGAWVLAAVLFVWQVPHFLALGWVHRRDYARAGIHVLPVLDRSGRATCVAIILYSLALLPVGLTATLCGMAGLAFAVCSAVLGTVLLLLGLQLYILRNVRYARRVFVASVVYLPLLLGLMMADRGPMDSRTPEAARAVATDSPRSQQGSPETVHSWL